MDTLNILTQKLSRPSDTTPRSTMNLLKIFLATLLLGILAVIVMSVFYTTSFSVVPRSLGVSVSDENDESAISEGSTVEERPVKEGMPKEFSLRELEQMMKQKQGVHESKPHLQTKENDLQSGDTDKMVDEHSDKMSSTNEKQQDLKEETMQDHIVKPNINILSNQTAIQTSALQQVELTIEQCDARINIVLLKTHKTGSSTVQNILYRFGDVRGLSFVLPSVDVYMGNPDYFNHRYIVQTPGGYNILANHARFHKGNMAKIMPTNTKYISILRFPPKQFESMYSYYSFNGKFHTSLEGFANNAKELYNKYEGRNPKHSALNPVLCDLGLPKANLANPTQIDKWIKFIDDSFNLILIAEYLQESLILLKELMCWSMEDIVYFSSNKRNESLVKQLPNKTTHQLLEWQSGDFKLYQYFNRTLQRKIEQYGKERMKRDVELLNKRNQELSDECLQGMKPVSDMGGKTLIDRYVLKPSAKKNRLCSRMTYAAYDYLTMLRQKQKLRRPGRKT